MKFLPTRIPGVLQIELEPVYDERGFFARSWCKHEFKEHGLNSNLTQCSISFNRERSTLRGMHWQVAPQLEAKLVRCTRGAVYDVALDLRPDSSTFKQWFAIELSAQSQTMLYIPEGCAHGFLTLKDESEVVYQISGDYSAVAARGVRFDDPAFSIQWPEAPRIVSRRDREWPEFIN